MGRQFRSRTAACKHGFFGDIVTRFFHVASRINILEWLIKKHSDQNDDDGGDVGAVAFG